jgi:hypothetical protein
LLNRNAEEIDRIYKMNRMKGKDSSFPALPLPLHLDNLVNPV